MARRRPQSFQAWVLGLTGAIITALILYYVRVAAIEHMGQRQIEHAQASMQRLQEQHASLEIGKVRFVTWVNLNNLQRLILLSITSGLQELL